MRSDLDDEQECGFDRDRHALAALLLSRNCQMAAKVVAVSRRCHPSCTTLEARNARWVGLGTP
jgi:hypothetical protein